MAKLLFYFLYLLFSLIVIFPTKHLLETFTDKIWQNVELKPLGRGQRECAKGSAEPRPAKDPTCTSWNFAEMGNCQLCTCDEEGLGNARTSEPIVRSRHPFQGLEEQVVPDAARQTLNETTPVMGSLGKLPQVPEMSAWVVWKALVEGAPVADMGRLSALGLQFIDHKEQLVVATVLEGGAIDMHNQGKSIRSILPGTVITEVNGVTGKPADMLREMSCSSTLRLALKRQRQYDIELRKDGALGLDCFLRTGVVRGILPGAIIDMHNQTCEPGFEVLPGDCLYACNSSIIVPQTFFQDLQSVEGLLRLTFHRP